MFHAIFCFFFLFDEHVEFGDGVLSDLLLYINFVCDLSLLSSFGLFGLLGLFCLFCLTSAFTFWILKLLYDYVYVTIG